MQKPGLGTARARSVRCEYNIRTKRIMMISLNSAMARYSMRKHIFIFKAYIRHRKLCGRTREAFKHTFPGWPIPS
ncbi:hypothetical protein C0J52_14910 [Blattella germanica]|nr:hypothetical protein C0J52_14910 [Blattella germanica]